MSERVFARDGRGVAVGCQWRQLRRDQRFTVFGKDALCVWHGGVLRTRFIVARDGQQTDTRDLHNTC